LAVAIPVATQQSTNMPKIKISSKLTDGVGELNQSVTLGLIFSKIPNSDSQEEVSLKLVELCYPQHDIDTNWGLADIMALNKDFESAQLPLDSSNDDYYQIGDIKFVMEAVKLKEWRLSEKFKGMKRVLNFLDRIELIDTGKLDTNIARANDLPPQYLSAVCEALSDLFKSAE
jgi:hypothetical protein